MAKQLLFLLLLSSFTMFAQNIAINEVCTKNNNVLTDDDFNQFTDWVELYNNQSVGYNISGYFLTDDTSNKTKWQFPANSIISSNEYIMVWTDDKDTLIDNFHANFKLSTNNECVALYDTDTNLIDLLVYPDQYGDISYGITPSGLAYFSTPTPLGANTTEAYYSDERNNSPSIQLPSGFYTAGTELVVADIPAGKQVRFTTDGSNPDETSTIYSEPVILTENTVFRAKTYGDVLPSKEASCSYLIDNTKQLPVVSLIIEPDFLWSDSIGIFNDFETLKRVGWERFSKIQYFNDNELKFETNNDIRLYGESAYKLPQKSFAVFANNEIEYQIFEGKELAEFDSFIMRSSSDDWTMTMMRDGFVHTIVQEKLDIDYQAYQPTVLYINGEYFGIFNLREKYNEDYLKNNHGIDKDSIDFLRLNYWGLSVEVIAGSQDKYFELLSFLNSNDLTNDEIFNNVKEYLDIDNYTNYIITQIYTGNSSYNHNIKAWRKNNISDGFKWLIFDTDRAYSNYCKQMLLLTYDHDPVFNKLLENINYRNHFLQKTCSHINATFRMSYIVDLVDSLKANIAQEMPFHIEKWAPTGGVQSMESWNSAVYVLKDFAQKRKDTLLHRLDSMYSLSGQVSVHLKKEPPQGGDVYIEDVLIPYNDITHTYFKGIPVKLIAKPRWGYNFVDWDNISSNDSIVLVFNANDTITARFEIDCDIPLTITEDAKLLKACSPYHFDNDLIVEEGATLCCEPGVQLFFGNDVQLKVYGSIEFVGTEGNPIVIKGEPDMYWKYIKSDAGNILLKYVEFYSGEKAISSINGGNLLIENCKFYESDMNTNDLISIYSAPVIITNNKFYGNLDNVNKDCIDCKSVPFGKFIGNLFYDISDDCIDVGENSLDISISQNEMYNCKSMAITIGESSVADIGRNIIAHCQGGVQVHTDAVATMMNNTLYNNEVGIKCFYKEDTPNSGGSVFVVNTIFSQCLEDYTLQLNSQIDITYCLSDKTLLVGTGNIYDDPVFIDQWNDDFNLQKSSPCIDAGDNFSPVDPDSTRADIGALYFDQTNKIYEFEDGVMVLYPNPAANSLFIHSTKKIIAWEMYDMSGVYVTGKKNFYSLFEQINVSRLQGGVYTLILYSKEERFIRKMVKN